MNPPCAAPAHQLSALLAAAGPGTPPAIPSIANCVGGERAAGLTPSLTLFRIFGNTDRHGYQSLGSSLATFALHVRLTKLFLRGADGRCGCTSACAHHGPSLHPQPATRLQEGKPAAGTRHRRGKAAAGPVAQAAFQSPFCCISPNPNYIHRYPVGTALLSCENKSAFIFPNACTLKI